MRKMKDSGIEWIGKIPKDWSIVRIKNVSSLFGRIGFRGYTQQDLVDEDDGAITLSPSNMKNMKMNYEKCSYISWFKYNESPEIKVENGDILFVKTGSTYGKSAYVTDLPKEATINPQLIVFKQSTMNKKLLAYVLQTSLISYQTELAVVGGTIPTMSQEKIKNFIFPIPPLPEQKKIADFLDEKCGEIDSIRSDIQKQIDILNDYKKSVITEAVTKGLNPKAKLKDSGIEWIGKIPEHWSVKRNKYIMRKQKILKAKYENEDILSLTMNGVVVRDLENLTGKRPASFDGYQIVYPNNLLMCLFDIDVTPRCVGLIKNYGLTSPAYSQFVMQDFAYAPYYYYYYLNIDMTKELLHLAKNLRHSLTEDDLGAISTVLPPISEQKVISSYLDDKCSEIDATIADKQKQLETLDEYKTSLIFEYVTGKKEVPA